MTYQSIPIDVTIVSTDRQLLKETTWTLSVFGYKASASNDWSEEAAWQQSTRSGVVLLDLRGADSDDLASLSNRGPTYTYRIAIGDQVALGDESLLGLFDDVVAHPVNSGELLARVRTAARRLEFERRREQMATLDGSGGLLTRRGLLMSLDGDPSSVTALALLGIDFYDVIVHEHGQHAAHRLVSTLGRRVHQLLGSDIEVAETAPGVIAVLLHGASLDEGLAAVERVVGDFASSETIARETRSRPSLSAVVAPRQADRPATELLERSESALEYAASYGGGRVAEVAAVEAEVDAWRDRVENGALLQNVVARHVMTPLPLTLGEDRLAARLADLRKAAAAGQLLPDCVPVVDPVGAVTAVVNLPALQRSANKKTAPSDAELLSEQFCTTPAGAALSDVLNAFSEHQTETLIVVEQGLPLGYITCNALTELYTAAVDSGAYRRSADACGVEHLAVPLAQPEACPEHPQTCEPELSQACEDVATA